MDATLVIPALNEEDSLPHVLEAVNPDNLSEVIPVDGGSQDRTVEIAEAHGARVLVEPRPGYGRACAAGVAARKGNPERAVRIFGAVEALRDAIGMPLLPADRRIFDPLVRVARTRMSKDDFARAWSTGRNMLAEGLEAVIDYALDSDAVPDKKTGTTSPHGLTVREVEVLRLVAQGLTDAQVAEQLVISPRTVNAHLTSIYSKMGVNSRAGATRFAVEEGLV